MSNLEFSAVRIPWTIGLANQLNLRTFPLHAHEVLLAAAAYQGLFAIISPVVSSRLAPESYEKAERRTRLSWDSKVVGFCQSLFICVKALMVIAVDKSRPDASVQQRLWGYSQQVGQVQAYAAGYFLWDIYLCFRYYSLFGPSPAVHSVAAFFVTMIGFRPFANYYGINFVLYELSTPFLNVHWILDKIGKTGSNLQLYNGLALIASFFGCRIVWGTYQTWQLSRDMLAAWRSGPVPNVLFATYLLANTTLTALNFYWFSRMLQALRKRFVPKINQKQE